MKGLFEICSDDCTYSYENLIFVMYDETPLYNSFKEKILCMYPNISDDQFLELVVNEEVIETVNTQGYKTQIQIQLVDFYN